MQYQKYILMAILLLSACQTLTAKAAGDVCHFYRISADFDFVISLNRDTGTIERIVKQVELSIYQKGTDNVLQRISFTPACGLGYVFRHVSRSYTTGYNSNAIAIDGDYGDIVVADLNFDGRADIAVKDEFTNGFGQLYRFYLQDKEGRFKEQKDLLMTGETDFVPVFPSKIDSAKRTLTFWRPMNAYEARITVYKCNSTTNRFVQIGNTIETYSNGRVVKRHHG